MIKVTYLFLIKKCYIKFENYIIYNKKEGIEVFDFIIIILFIITMLPNTEITIENKLFKYHYSSNKVYAFFKKVFNKFS